MIYTKKIEEAIKLSIQTHELDEKEMINELFGESAMKLVLSVTEEDKSKSWEARKTEALEHIRTFSHDSLLLKSADLISNSREIIADYEKEGDEMFSKFNAPKEKILESYTKTMKAIIEMWPESPLALDLLSSVRGLADTTDVLI